MKRDFFVVLGNQDLDAPTKMTLCLRDKDNRNENEEDDLAGAFRKNAGSWDEDEGKVQKACKAADPGTKTKVKSKKHPEYPG